jgi:hypothetical protein
MNHEINYRLISSQGITECDLGHGGQIKYAHFVPQSHPYTASIVAKLFMVNIFKLHGMPITIANDRDPVFTSNFWKEIFRLSDTELLMSSTYHPQTNG